MHSLSRATGKIRFLLLPEGFSSLELRLGCQVDALGITSGISTDGCDAMSGAPMVSARRHPEEVDGASRQSLAAPLLRQWAGVQVRLSLSTGEPLRPPTLIFELCP